MVRSLRLLLLVSLAACGSDSSGDAGNGGTIDAPTGAIDSSGPIIDSGSADLPSDLGDLCATTAPDGSPAACGGGTICCMSGAGYFCTFPDDCSTGGGF